MVKLTGKYLKEERLKQGLNTAELARLMGYKNVSKGMNRIIELERENIVIPEVLKRIVDALNLDLDHVHSLIRKDRDEDKRKFEEWANEPVEMYYIIRLMPTIYLSYDLPTNIKTEEEAVEFVAGIAKEKHNKCWVVLSRREKVYITEDGEIRGKIINEYDDKHYPYVRVKKKSFKDFVQQLLDTCKTKLNIKI